MPGGAISRARPASPGAPPGASGALILAGRYAIFHGGRESGEERWRIEARDSGLIATAEQVLQRPHPFPSRQEWRAALTSDWRLTGLEILWTVAERRLRSLHTADGPKWRVRIEYAGQVREQHGDFPPVCEVEYASPLFNAFILARRDFALGGEHEFPVLRIGPPWMAVSPDRMRVRCVEVGRFETTRGPVAAKRYIASQPAPGDAGTGDLLPGEDAGYSFWADERGVVLEAHEGLDPSMPWMKLIEYREGGA